MSIKGKMDICNPSYLGGRDRVDRSLSPVAGRRLVRFHLNEQAEHGGMQL
jgi:hypothetical protein